MVILKTSSDTKQDPSRSPALSGTLCSVNAQHLLLEVEREVLLRRHPCFLLPATGISFFFF